MRINLGHEKALAKLPEPLILAERVGFEPTEENNPFACFRVVLKTFFLVLDTDGYSLCLMFSFDALTFNYIELLLICYSRRMGVT